MKEVEFARCLRLRQTSLEPVAFRLPRVRVSLGEGLNLLFLWLGQDEDLSSYLFVHPNLSAVYLWGNICLHSLLKFCKVCECQCGWGQVSGLMCPGPLVSVSG